MIDIDTIRHQPDLVKEHMQRRGVDPAQVDKLLALDQEWRVLAQTLDSIRQKQNEFNTRIAQAEANEKAALIEEMKIEKGKLQAGEAEFQRLGAARMKAWRSLPNLLGAGVPDGGADQKEVISPAKPPTVDFPQKSYLELAGDRIEIERAAKVSGSRFSYIMGDLARLQMALVSFVFDQLTKPEAGFIPVIPPVLVKETAMAGMGYLDQAGEEIYKTQDDLYLVGTSEQAIGPLHMGEIFEADQLPRRYVGYSSCFRREAGSHGKDVKGILRQHQFEKIEMFSFTEGEADASDQEHQFLLTQQKMIMDALELPYQVVMLAAQDLGAPSAKTYDIETWIPSEGVFRETHSTSNTADYQARRLKIRYKHAEGSRHIHMLNGTALAIGRTLIALLENHQQADGSVAIPAALQAYMPFKALPTASHGS